MRAVDLADREEMRQVDRLPPMIARQSAVVVLGTDGDLQRFGRDVDVVSVKGLKPRIRNRVLGEAVAL